MRDLVSCRLVLSLLCTGLLVCRGVDEPESSAEVPLWVSRGGRGRVPPLGASLQDTDSGDSAGTGEVGVGAMLTAQVWLFLHVFLTSPF